MKGTLNTSPSRQKSGFALIVTVSIMILLALLAVGLLSLSTVSMRSSAHGAAQAKARANAKLSLQLAVGQLQKLMGPDTRISANGDVLDDRISVKKPYRRLAGAWNSWSIDPENVGDYESRKDGDPEEDQPSPQSAPIPRGGFHGWLASAPKPEDTENLDFVTTEPSQNSVQLWPETDQSADNALRVSKIPISEKIDNKDITTGEYGWAIVDEGQKAALNPIPEDPNSRSSTPLQRAGLQSEPAWSHVAEWQEISNLPDSERPKLISNESLAVAGITDVEKYTDDITPFTSAVLADASNGGLKTDLSLLFQDEELPSDFEKENTYLYSNSSDPLVSPSTRAGHPYQFPNPEPKWSLLHQYYRVPQDLLVGSGEDARINFRMVGTDSKNSFPFRMRNLRPNRRYADALKIAPVISKAQFIFSMSYSSSNSLWQNSSNWPAGTWRNDPWPGSGPQQSPWHASATLFVDPIITLWNPYDVPMDVNDFRIYLYRIPLSFNFTTDNPNWKNNDPSYYTDFADMGHFKQNQGTAGEPAPIGFPLSIKPEPGQNSITLLPGEHRVFSAHNQVNIWWFISGNSKKAGSLDMRPGWHPPGSGSNYTGGIAIDYLAAGRQGQRSAQFYGYPSNPNHPKDKQRWSSTSHVLVNRADTVTVSVKPSVDNAGIFKTVGEKPLDFYLRYGTWVENSSIKPDSEHTEHPDFGAIEFNYGEDIEDVFTPLAGGIDLPRFPINNNVADIDHEEDTSRDRKKPFLVATLHLKSLVNETSTANRYYPNKAWINANPSLIYASAGMDDNNKAGLSAQQYQFSYEPLQGDWANNVPEISGDRHGGFGGPSPGVTYGRPFAPFASLPRTRLTSVAQFRHAPLNQSGRHPLQAQVVGNSFAHPLLDADVIVDEQKSRLDHSFLANARLFDGTFFSTAANNAGFRSAIDGDDSEIIDPRLRFTRDAKDPENLKLFQSDNSNGSHEQSAAFLMLDGAFNVNSTSKRAWMAFLSGFNGPVPILESLDKEELGEVSPDGSETLLSRYNIPLDETLGDNLDPFGTQSDGKAWAGMRRLDDSEIEKLADEIVKQVKLRGPFQSLGEFVNRRAEEGELGLSGCLQSAIDLSNINRVALQSTGIELSGTEEGSESYENPEAAEGSTLVGTPGYITQADLLNSIAPYITVRSDTFRIRGYGSSTDAAGNVQAEAWCEAVVQRNPRYLDQSDKPYDYADPASGDYLIESEVNRKFGRAFQVVSFRWLNKSEVTS